MPGWHAYLKSLKDAKDLVVLGVIQEQHAERCSLFAQWQRFDWPILHDPLNLLGLRAVPVVIAIDEHGVVRSTRPRQTTFREAFWEREFPAPKTRASVVSKPDLAELERAAEDSNTAAGWQTLGDSLLLWARNRETEAIAAYRKALDRNAEDSAPLLFRMGVAYRRRHESSQQQEADFAQAVRFWGRALDADPNQYIYRRRIQQFGPRLAKPYPFYDWVAQAREDIRARNETPVRLPVDPSGAEIASPVRSFLTTDADAKSPDPQGRVTRDTDWVTSRTVVVPDRVQAGQSVRVHLELQLQGDAHWNNEAELLVVWLDPPRGLQVDRRQLTFPSPKKVESRETRRLEFEVQTSIDQKETVSLRGFALYNICEAAGGQCLYRRHDFEVRIEVR